MQAVRDMLIGLGFDMENYNQESFGAPVESEADAPELDDVVPEESATAEISFAASRRHGDLHRDRYGAGGGQGLGPQHPIGLLLWHLRHLQGQEDRGRRAYGPQWRHFGGGCGGGLHPCLLFQPDWRVEVDI